MPPATLTLDQKRQLIRIYRAAATLLIDGHSSYCCEAIQFAARSIGKSYEPATSLLADYFKPELARESDPWWWVEEQILERYEGREARLIALLLMVEIVKDM